MKRIVYIITIAFLSISFVTNAVQMKDLKIYINPGHGGYDSDDRNIVIYPYQQGDTLGYWESKSNLYKGLAMYHILDSLGTKAYLSRIKNTTNDDRSLSGISQEANSNNCDLFFSIHSNAGETVNYPLTLYRENAVGTPRYPEAVKLSNILWDNLHSSKLAQWTRDERYVSGDLTFYPQWGNSGLGVLRNLYLPGLLSEGQMHEHRPEAHRLMNMDYLWLEAWHFVKSIMEYYDTEDRFVTGNIAGIVYDDNNTRADIINDRYAKYGIDVNKALNGAYVELRDNSGKVVQKRTTDDMNNGVFVFRNLLPGNYVVSVSKDGYYNYQKEVEVKACDVTYNNAPMSLRREAPLEITGYSPDGLSEVNCVQPIEFKFNHDISAESFRQAFKISPAVDGEILFDDSYHTVIFKPLVAFDVDTKYTVTLTTDLCTPDPYYSQSHLPSQFTFEFTTQARNKLEMIKSYPAENGTVHYKLPTFEFRFDKKLDAYDILKMVHVYDVNGEEIPSNGRTSSYNKLNGDYGNIILKLNGNLTPGEKYYVILSGKIKDKEGIPLTDDIKINFVATDESIEKDGEVLEPFESSDVLVANSDESKGLVQLPTVSLRTTSALFGNGYVGLSYEYSNMKDGVVIADYNNGYKNVRNGDKIGLHVYGDVNDHELFLGFKNGTDIKYQKICNDDFIGWKYFEIQLTTLEDAVDYSFSNIKLVQTPSTYATKGSILFDNLLKLNKSGCDNVNSDNANCIISQSNSVISVLTNEDVLRLDVCSTIGALVATSQTCNLDCKNLPNGVYIVRVVTNKGIYSKSLSL